VCGFADEHGRRAGVDRIQKPPGRPVVVQDDGVLPDDRNCLRRSWTHGRLAPASAKIQRPAENFAWRFL